MRVLGELRFEFEPDDNGDDEYPELNEIEKNQKDITDDMTVGYIHERLSELGIDKPTKVRIIPSISGVGSEIGDGELLSSNDSFSMKRIEFVKEEDTVYLHF